MFIETQDNIIINSFNIFLNLTYEDIRTNPFRAFNLLESIRLGYYNMDKKIKDYPLLRNSYLVRYIDFKAKYAYFLIKYSREELNNLTNG